MRDQGSEETKQYLSFTWFVKVEFLHTGACGFTVNTQNANE